MWAYTSDIFITWAYIIQPNNAYYIVYYYIFLGQNIAKLAELVIENTIIIASCSCSSSTSSTSSS